jgi:hypothetical protein
MSTITIQGHDFTVPERYTEGHPLTEGEAKALNQTYHENLRNNFAKQVKDAKGEAAALTSEQVTDLQSKLDTYAESYSFGVRVAGSVRAPADPVGKEAFSIAREAVKAQIRKQGKNPNSYEAKQIAEIAQAALEKNKDRFYEIARQRIAEREAIAGDALGVDVGELAPAPVAEGASEEKPASKRGKKAA